MERVSEAGRMLVARKADIKASIRRETEELGRIEAALSALGVSLSGDGDPVDEGALEEGVSDSTRVVEHGGATMVGVGGPAAPVERNVYRRPRTKKRAR